MLHFMCLKGLVGSCTCTGPVIALASVIFIYKYEAVVRLHPGVEASRGIGA
jgi:hypothetical protein